MQKQILYSLFPGLVRPTPATCVGFVKDPLAKKSLHQHQPARTAASSALPPEHLLASDEDILEAAFAQHRYNQQLLNARLVDGAAAPPPLLDHHHHHNPAAAQGSCGSNVWLIQNNSNSGGGSATMPPIHEALARVALVVNFAVRQAVLYNKKVLLLLAHSVIEGDPDGGYNMVIQAVSALHDELSKRGRRTGAAAAAAGDDDDAAQKRDDRDDDINDAGGDGVDEWNQAQLDDLFSPAEGAASRLDQLVSQGVDSLVRRKLQIDQQQQQQHGAFLRGGGGGGSTTFGFDAAAALLNRNTEDGDALLKQAGAGGGQVSTVMYTDTPGSLLLENAHKYDCFAIDLHDVELASADAGAFYGNAAGAASARNTTTTTTTTTNAAAFDAAAAGGSKDASMHHRAEARYNILRLVSLLGQVVQRRQQEEVRRYAEVQQMQQARRARQMHDAAAVPPPAVITAVIGVPSRAFTGLEYRTSSNVVNNPPPVLPSIAAHLAGVVSHVVFLVSHKDAVVKELASLGVEPPTATRSAATAAATTGADNNFALMMQNDDNNSVVASSSTPVRHLEVHVEFDPALFPPGVRPLFQRAGMHSTVLLPFAGGNNNRHNSGLIHSEFSSPNRFGLRRQSSVGAAGSSTLRRRRLQRNNNNDSGSEGSERGGSESAGNSDGDTTPKRNNNNNNNNRNRWSAVDSALFNAAAAVANVTSIRGWR